MLDLLPIPNAACTKQEVLRGGTLRCQLYTNPNSFFLVPDSTDD